MQKPGTGVHDGRTRTRPTHAVADAAAMLQCSPPSLRSSGKAQQLQQQLDTEQRQHDQTRQQLLAEQQQHEATKQELQTAQQQLDNLQQQYDQLLHAHDELQKQYSSLQADVQALQEQREAQQAEASKQQHELLQLRAVRGELDAAKNTLTAVFGSNVSLGVKRVLTALKESNGKSDSGMRFQLFVCI